TETSSPRPSQGPRLSGTVRAASPPPKNADGRQLVRLSPWPSPLFPYRRASVFLGHDSQRQIDAAPSRRVVKNQTAVRRTDVCLLGQERIGRTGARRLFLLTGSFEITQRSCPDLPGNEPPCDPGVEIVLLEVDPAIAPGQARLVGRLPEGRPAQSQVLRGNGPGFDLRTPGE